VSRWRNSRERERILEADCEEFAAQLHLVDAREEGAFGRWLLRGRWSWAEVVSLRGGIYVGGDIETVVFQGGGDLAKRPRGRVYWMATRSYGYASEKAHLGNTAPDEWDESCARGAILDHRKCEQLTREEALNLWNLLKRGDVSRSEFASAVYDETHDAELCDMGDVTSRRVYMATAIMRRLAHLLDCRDMQQASREWFRRAA
jgi:hypothetical protein